MLIIPVMSKLKNFFFLLPQYICGNCDAFFQDSLIESSKEQIFILFFYKNL